MVTLCISEKVEELEFSYIADKESTTYIHFGKLMSSYL